MKTYTTCLFLLVAACGGLIASPSTTVAADRPAAKMYHVDRVDLGSHPTITAGSSRALVLQTIGYPTEQLTPNLWLYRKFGPANADVAKDASGGLVIGFTGDRVSSLHLLSDGARKAIIARVKAGHVANEVVLDAIPEMPTGTAVAEK